MVYHLTIQLSNHWSIKIEIADEEGAGGYVEDGAGESFVKWGVAVAEAGEAGAGAQSGGKGGAEGEEGVFGCMVVVDYRKRWPSDSIDWLSRQKCELAGQIPSTPHP